ncbi:heme lyase CcmF/NrfE family subunit [bacterium]|nr:heme lyase CcmF/NrfE family subunit [bacterium]
MQDLSIVIGHWSLFIGFVAAGWTVVGSLLSVVGRGQGLQRSAERAVLVTAAASLIACVCLWIGFITNDFRLDYVYHYSSSSQPLPYKLGALWGGQSGSLLLWTTMLTVMCAAMVITNRTKNRILMPWATAVAGIVIGFFMHLINFVESPFAISVMRADGVGLNPQLKNFWMMIHPPTLYLGYVAFTIPFAFAIAALITKRTGDIWFRTTRRWTIFAWFSLGTGILLGSYWAYIELGWGGYWAWDPVENASLMPWLTGTAFLHSVMIQEKRNMLRVWNMLLIIITFSLCIFGTFLTRSGVISSVHSFATSDIGPMFAWFLGFVFFGALILLILRLDTLKTENRLESVLSRESTFLFNNLVLVGIAATVLLLTTFPMISEVATGRKVTMGPPIFNLVNIPWALFLLFLMGTGPLIAWRRASKANLQRNFVVPGLIGFWVFAALIAFNIRSFGPVFQGIGEAIGHADVAGVLDEIKAFYPALTFGLGAFVIGTAGLEYWRGVRVRVHNHGESMGTALSQLIWRNKRRYAGYIVHVGIVLIFFGVAGSAAYQKETVQTLFPGQVLEVDHYIMRYDGYDLVAKDDYLSSRTSVSLFRRGSGESLGSLRAEQRIHPNMMVPDLRETFPIARDLCDQGSPDCVKAVTAIYDLIPRLEQQFQREVKTPSTEVGIKAALSPFQLDMWGEDFYVIPLHVNTRTGEANFRVFVNPMVNFIWFGGLVFVLGSIITILPDAREKRRLEAALAVEERAVA